MPELRSSTQKAQKSAMNSASTIAAEMDAIPPHGMTDSTHAFEHELTGYVPHLKRMSDQLTLTSNQIEKSVVAVCGNFYDIASRAKATVDRAHVFLSADNAQSTNNPSFETLIDSCSATMVKILQTRDEAAEISRRAIERVQKMDKASQDISGALRQLEQIAHENKMLAMNARIEAAHAGELGAGFAIVAVEVVSQTEKTKAVTANVAALIGDLRGLADSTVKDLQSMEERERKRMEQCRYEVDEALANLQATHGEMKQMLSTMSEDSALLANDIGAAVRGLQFQDRTKQQIAHVVDDLNTMHARLMTHVGEAPIVPAAGLSNFTMYEERLVAGTAENESAAGEVELF